MTVHLVGAGPGDPDLITVRGARLLERADVVVYDRLAAPLLCLVGREAELIDVGKEAGGPAASQDEINAILVDRGRRHDCVVRLKGGDPFVFARGGEETAVLAKSGVPVEVVPGISSALGAPALSGIPLTLRGVSQSFTVVSGHEDPGQVPAERWNALAALGGTLVVLMGAGRIGAVARRLVGAGLPATTPVAALRQASLPGGEVIESCLGEIGSLPHSPPTTFVIGEVVRHRVAVEEPVTAAALFA